MKDGTIAIIIDNNNPATLDMVLDFRALFMDDGKIVFVGLPWHIIEHEIVPAHGNMSSQDVFILEWVKNPEQSKVSIATDSPVS